MNPMENQEEHVEVAIEEEKKASDEPKIEIIEEKSEGKPEVSPEEGIQAMKKRLEAAENARLEAEKRARDAAERANKASSETKDANYQLVVNAIETVKGRAESIKQAYASAMSSGDYEKAAQLQEALAINAQQLSELKRGKKAMKQEIEKGNKTPEQLPQEVSKEPMIDQLARQVSPRSASWIRENKDILDNERMIRRMFRAHEDAVDDGIAPDSDEYFSFIETRLGIRHQEIPQPRKSSPPPSAPVTRGGQRPNVVRLSRDQVEMAKMMGMSESDYAKNMVALQREGKIGH
jgi:hypothetical protein